MMNNIHMFPNTQEAMADWAKENKLIEKEINMRRAGLENALLMRDNPNSCNNEVMVEAIEQLMESLIKELEYLRQLKYAFANE